MLFSTIAAVSTPHGKGGIAVLRMSGTDSFSIAERIFRPACGKRLSELPKRTQIYGSILSADGSSVLDDGLVTCFSAPHSFTGEDVVEISCHGGEIVTGMILSALLSSGASYARQGEFSRRAFINGKLSLTAAEGIADLLDAKTEAAAQLSSKAARGKLSEAILQISDGLLEIASSLWAYLDYPEEDLQSLSDDEMMDKLSHWIQNCEKLVQSYQTGRAVNSGIPAAIVGKPNVGKSTFFNRVLGEDRAIVTSVPGTTRDVIEYPVKMGRVLLNLSDTAGVREKTTDSIEKIGIERTFSALSKAEVVFALFDLSRPLDDEDQAVLDRLAKKENAFILPILTKSDLPFVWNPALLSHLPQPIVSGEDFDGTMKEIVRRIETYLISDEIALQEGRILSNARQKACLEAAAERMKEASLQIQSGEKDVASLTLEDALASLNEVDGKTAGEMILDQVFSRFCVGK